MLFLGLGITKNCPFRVAEITPMSIEKHLIDLMFQFPNHLYIKLHYEKTDIKHCNCFWCQSVSLFGERSKTLKNISEKVCNKLFVKFSKANRRVNYRFKLSNTENDLIWTHLLIRSCKFMLRQFFFDVV